MSRWSPDAKRRLQDAALELFAENGYAGTTVAAVAGRAGLTERTFFRHFEDKKEVLFIENGLAELVAARSAGSEAPTTLERAADGFRAIGRELRADPPRVRRRAGIIAATPELREREMGKFAQWTTAVTRALAGDGVEPRAAVIAAEVATSMFRIAYVDWLDAGADADLIATYDAVLAVHRSITATTTDR